MVAIINFSVIHAMEENPTNLSWTPSKESIQKQIALIVPTGKQYTNYSTEDLIDKKKSLEKLEPLIRQLTLTEQHRLRYEMKLKRITQVLSTRDLSEGYNSEEELTKLIEQRKKLSPVGNPNNKTAKDPEIRKEDLKDLLVRSKKARERSSATKEPLIKHIEALRSSISEVNKHIKQRSIDYDSEKTDSSSDSESDEQPTKRRKVNK